MSGHRHIDLSVLVLLGLSMGAGAVLDYLGDGIGLEVLIGICLSLLIILWLVWLREPARGSVLRSAGLLLPLLLVWSYAAWILWRHAPTDAQKVIPVGILTGTGVLLGWVVTYLIGDVREQTALDRTRRDTLTALRHEIFALVDKLDNQDIWAHAKDVQERIAQGDGTTRVGKAVPYHPYSTMESQPIIFEAVSGSIPTIKAATVAAIVRFYAEYTDLRRMIEDSRSDIARSLSPERRVNLHKQLTKRRASTLSWGLKALEEIGRDLGESDYEEINRSGKNEGITPEKTGDPDE